TDFERLKEHFVNNYGEEYLDDAKFIEELVVCHLVEKAFFDQPVRLVADPEANKKDRKQGRIDLPKEIIDKIEEMESIQEFTLPDGRTITRLVPDVYLELKNNLENLRTKLDQEMGEDALGIDFERVGEARGRVITDTKEKLLLLHETIGSICIIGGTARNIFNGTDTTDIDFYFPDELSDLVSHICNLITHPMNVKGNFVRDSTTRTTNEFSVNRVSINIHTNKVIELGEGAIDDLLNMRLRVVGEITDKNREELRDRAIRVIK
ncbi:hypothetical protein MUO65_02365, partial [bacterium]|nr:hypothetical protein [bacterium]